MADLSATPRPRPRMLFGERTFGLYFVLWGLLLQLDHLDHVFHLSPDGIFFFELECYAPGWLWGSAMLAIGIGRYFAHRANHAKWRMRLSSATIVVLSLIAGVSIWAGLIGATAPLACFAVFLAIGFHRMLAKDIALGL